MNEPKNHDFYINTRMKMKQQYKMPFLFLHNDEVTSVISNLSHTHTPGNKILRIITKNMKFVIPSVRLYALSTKSYPPNYLYNQIYFLTKPGITTFYYI